MSGQCIRDDSNRDLLGDPTESLDRLTTVTEQLDGIDAGEDECRDESGHLERGTSKIMHDFQAPVSVGFGSDRDSQSPFGSAAQPKADSQTPIIETREINETELVVADLTGTAESDFDVTLDSEQSMLKLWVDRECIDRITLDRRKIVIIDVTQNNRVLEVRLTQTDDTLNSDSNGR